MKTNRLLWLGILTFFISAYSQALTVGTPVHKASPSSGSDWYLGLGLGPDFPAQNWDTDFSVGGGANIFLGRRLDSVFAIQLSVNPAFYTGNGLTVSDLKISPELRISNPSSGWASYILLGPGYDFQFASPSGYSTSSLAVVTGIGFDFTLRPGEHAFIEGRYNFAVYNNLTQQDMPILLGLSEDL